MGPILPRPVFGEISPLANVAITGRNLSGVGLSTDTQPISTSCTPGQDLPPEGSGAWKVASSFGDGTPGSANTCAGPNFVLPNGYVLSNPQEPYGITFLGGSAGAAIIRQGGLKGFSGLTPELATNWGIGFDYTPSANFLTGLNIQATYYIIKINSLLTGFGNPNTGSFNDPDIGDFAFIVPTDYLDTTAEGAAACTNNLLPTTCAPFQAAVQDLINNPRAAIDPQAKTLIFWINDGGAFNKGWLKMEGIDWSASYDWEWGNLGAFNVGIAGTYYLHRKNQSVPGAEIDRRLPPDHQQKRTERGAGHRDATANALSRESGLVQRPVVRYGVHGLSRSLLPHAERAAQRERQFLRLEWRVGCQRRRRDLYLRDRCLQQSRAVLLHVRFVARLQHVGHAGQRIPAKHRCSAGDPECLG